MAAGVAAYALSPLDLIPDFVPVLGYLDDLIVLPLGIMLAVQLIPPQLWEEHRSAAAAWSAARPRSWRAAAVIAGSWIALGIAALLWLRA